MALKIKSNRNKKRSKPLSYRLLMPMLLLSILQVGVFFGTLAVGGEFKLLKNYAYNMFVEKTENRKNYVENLMTKQIAPSYETAREINTEIENYLQQNGFEPSDLMTNKVVNKQAVRQVVPKLIELLRKSGVNDVFLILDSGELYNSNGAVRKSGIYFRDQDVNSNDREKNTDLILELGSSDIAREFGIALDSQWTTYLELNRVDEESLRFVSDTIKTAKQYPRFRVQSLGRWTGFTSIAPKGQPSMKYTFPLRASDGTIYGVFGIGIMEKTFLSTIPANDFFNQNACYILGVDENGDGEYTPVIHSGAKYSHLINEKTSLNEANRIGMNLYDFQSDTDFRTIGCLMPMKLYDSGSPYIREKWALISVADRDGILNIYDTIIVMMMIASAITILFGLLFAVFISRRITTPVVEIASHLDEKMKENAIIRFEPSGITEIDQLSGRITELQISVKEQASKVSKIISMADMGIGVFMCDLRKHNVFLGESLIKLLEIDFLPVEDTVVSEDTFFCIFSKMDGRKEMDEQEFLKKIRSMTDETETMELYSKEFNRWFRVSFMAGNHTTTGLVMDVTGSVIEKKKIEYERDYDVTTGLLNRRAYFNRVEEIFQIPEVLHIAAIVMFDLDNLKYVNDTYGHDYGDDYIKTAANIFKSFRSENILASRLSGDEFNLFFYGFENKDQIREKVERIMEKVKESYCTLADGSHFKLRISGGISWYPDDAEDFHTLAKYADFAMYTIKHSTKGKLAEFNRDYYNKDSILITGVEEMNRIIDEEHIKYAFQSIISAKTGEIYGYEALMRPQSQIFKSPLDFIRIAKKGAKLYEIERLTWTLSLRSFRALRENGTVPSHAKIFINSLSDCKMKEEDVALVEKENGNLLSQVILEILEGEQMNEDFMNAKKRRVASWNAMIALDDFGSGYNSEYALITLKPDMIKIDRAIINGCDSDLSRRNIITNLVSHAKIRDILVLAEGVETESELRTVIECGVDLLQGYYIDRPLFEPKPVPESIREVICSFAESGATVQR